MKKIVFFIVIILFGLNKIYGQTGVGINTQTPEASLDIRAINELTDGVLLSNVNQFSSSDPSVNQDGMLVFLDNAINEGAGFEGLYFWDAEEDVWQYIFQSKMLDMNLFKTIIQGPGFSIISSDNSNTNIWFKTTFNSIEAPDGNYKLNNGDLVVGKTGYFSLFFTGGVYKGVGSLTATPTEVGIFIDNDIIPSFLSKTPLAAADNGNRSTNHTISEIAYLTKGQVISVKTRRTSNINTEMGPSSIYTLTLSYLD